MRQSKSMRNSLVPPICCYVKRWVGFGQLLKPERVVNAVGAGVKVDQGVL